MLPCSASRLVVVALLLSAGSACRREDSEVSIRGPLASTAKVRTLQGTWCVATNPLVYNYLLEDHSTAEVRARMREVRTLDTLRVTVRGTSMTITDSTKLAGSQGTLIEHGRHSLRVDWNPGVAPVFFPKGVVAYELHEDGIRLEWGGDWYLLIPATNPSCVVTRKELALGAATTYQPASAESGEASPWSGQEMTHWPQIVLTNDATFQGGAALEGASAFLIEVDGRVYAATAKHLIGDAGGVEPEVSLPQLNEKLSEWRLHVRSRPTPFVRATRLAMKELARAEKYDWLFMELGTSNRGKLPASPLSMRATPVHLNERVFLIGCEYQELECQQRVFDGRVTGRMGENFRIELAQPVQIRGFSGAPIVDARGHAVGVMTVQFSPFKIGDDYLEAGGQDAALGMQLLAGTK